jgi:16S rRNA (cytosine967-C5)-methyltransferase
VPPFDSLLDVKIALRALVLVEAGLSEKSAVARAASESQGLRENRREAVRLVIEVVAQKDLFDSILSETLPRTRMSTRERCLGRLTTFLLLNNPGKIDPGAFKVLRELAPDGFRQHLEYLLGFLSNPDNIPSMDLRDAERVAIATHHPAWWVDYCFRLLGRASAIGLLSAPERSRYLRVNSLRNRGRTSLPKDTAIQKGSLAAVESFPGIYTVLDPSTSYGPLFSKGLFQYQDLASYAAVLACQPKPGESVLDLCAAPGAKTCAIAAQMKNRGNIVSVDYSRSRMKSWTSETERLGVKIASPVVADVTRMQLQGLFDLVLVDPPCSGTGIFDRNPRMKWHLTSKSIERYSKLQSEMLESASRFLAPKGRLVYCTCSVTVEENEDVVSRFLSTHPEMETRPVPLDHSKGSPGLRGLSQCRRFYPNLDGTAGYFIARLERLG